MEHFKDAHYFQLPSQGNIYTFSSFRLINGLNKVLVATLKREVFSFEYQESPSGALKPILKEIPFTYIPSGAEIIALDVFNKSDDRNDFVIGIAIVKNNVETNSMESFLNIYSEWDDTSDLNLESLAQSCFNIELNFVPYHLSHTTLVNWECHHDETLDKVKLKKEKIILLSGGDCHLHIFRENKSNHGYKEVDLKEFFPEFSKAPSVVTWVDIQYYNEDMSTRLSAFSCECGYMKVCKINSKTNEVVFNWSTHFINSITCVKIYLENEIVKTPQSIKRTMLVSRYDERNEPILNLVCVNSILPPVVFRDVLKYGLQKYDTLRRVDNTSVLSCCEVADVDLNGTKEILIGSSGEEISIFKFNPLVGFQFEKERMVVSPVLGIKYLDITGDGLKELIVFTLKGVYIFQYDHKHVEAVLKNKINILSSIL